MKPLNIHADENGRGSLAFPYSVHIANVSLIFYARTLIGVWLRETRQRYRLATGPTMEEQMEDDGIMILPSRSDMEQHLRDAYLADASVMVRTTEELEEIVRGALFEHVVAAPLNQV